MRTLVLLAKVSAVLAGILLTFITVMTCVSIVGRELFGSAITGDFELSGAATGAAIAMFMPWCQAKRGTIIVDFFTAGCSHKTNAVFDRFGAFLLAVCFGTLAWRTGLGGLSSYVSNSGTMIVGFPEWVVYACMAPSFALTCLIALVQVALGFDDPLSETA